MEDNNLSLGEIILAKEGIKLEDNCKSASEKADRLAEEIEVAIPAARNITGWGFYILSLYIDYYLYFMDFYRCATIMVV